MAKTAPEIKTDTENVEVKIEKKVQSVDMQRIDVWDVRRAGYRSFVSRMW